MGHEERWRQALVQARQLIESMPATDEAQIVGAGDLVEVVAGPSADKSVLLAGLQALKPGVSRMDYGELLAAVSGLVRESAGLVQLHLISDMQQTALPTKFSDLVPEVGAGLMLYDVSETNEANWAIVAVRHDKTNRELAVDVHGFQTPQTDKTISATVNGARVQSQQMLIPAADGAQARLALADLELVTGFNRIQVMMQPDDGLAVDDTHFLVLEHDTPKRILFLTAGRDQQEAVYFETAVQALENLAVELIHRPASDPLTEPLADFDGGHRQRCRGLANRSDCAARALRRSGRRNIHGAGSAYGEDDASPRHRP